MALFFWLLSQWRMINERNQKRLEAAKRRTLETQRRVLEIILQNEEEDERRAKRRRRMIHTVVGQAPRPPCAWTLTRASLWWDVSVPSFTHVQWIQSFRMSEETFGFVCNKVRPAMERQNTSFRCCVPLKKRVAIALWKLATGCEYRSIAQRFGVSMSTVCRCVQDFCAAAEVLLVPDQVRFPDSDRFMDMSVFIEDKWGLPQCVGAIGGSHIPIITPPDFHNDYCNRSGWPSVVLQAVVDGQGQFWHVFAGMPGCMEDADVLRRSMLWELASRGSLFPPHTRDINGLQTGYYLLGDSAYPLQKWLLRPFSHSDLTAEQQLYNNRVSPALAVVQHAFTRLKGRWRCLMKRNDSDIELVKTMVLACCALHNLCEHNGESYETDWDDLPVTEPTASTESPGEEDEGRTVRDALVQHLGTLQV